MTSLDSDKRPPEPLAPLGPFDLLSYLGEGAMGQVWRARHRDQDVPAAVKVITDTRAQHTEYHHQFRQEIRAVAGLSHPGIVMVFDYGEVDEVVQEATLEELRANSPYLAMELCPKGSLAGVDRQLSFASIRSILLSLLDALAHAHARGVIHRDIKPANILLGDDSDWTGVKLTDFGLAFVPDRVEGADFSTRGACGTPAFMSPEQFLGQWRDVGPWTDLYSLGCLAYFLVCGVPPYDGNSIVAVAKKHLRQPVPRLDPQIVVPSEFEGWVRRLLQKDPLERYRNAADAAWELLLMDAPDEPARAAKERDGEFYMGGHPSTLILKPFDNLLGSTGPRRAYQSDSPEFDEQLPAAAETDVERDGEAPLLDARRAPVATSWQHMVGRRSSMQLLGAGLGLYGLRHIPLVGREAERSALWSTLCEVDDTRQPRGVLLRGPAGVGKSFLAEWICERAQESGAAIRLTALHSPSPGGSEGLSKMLARYFRTAGLDREAIVERLRKWYRARGVDDPYEWNALAELIEPATQDDIDSGQQRIQFTRPQQRYALIVRLLETIAQERPIIVWLDDLQWATDSLAFFRFCFEQNRSEDLPLMLVGTIREEALADESLAKSELARFATEERITHLQLDPLPKYEHAEFVEKLLYLAPSLARRVADRTDGNPLFAVQLIGDWVERGVLEPAAEGFVLADGDEALIPDDLFSVWSSRLDEVLSGAPREMLYALELAGVLGMDVDETEWRECVEIAGYAYPDAAVQALLAARLFEDTDTGVRFAHGMLRESLERRAQEGGRLVEHNRLCAKMLQGRYEEQPRLAERLGRHLLAARAYLDALEPLLEGAKARGNAGEHEAVLRLLDLRQTALEALGLPDTCIPQVENDLVRSVVMGLQAHHDQALALAQKGVDAAAKLDDSALLAEAIYRRGKCHHMHGDYQQALDDLDEALRRVPATDERPKLVADISESIGAILTRLGRFDEAIAKLTPLLDDTHVFRQITCYFLIGSAERRRGNLERASEFLDVAKELYDDYGSHIRGADLMLELGEIARMRGELDEAADVYRETMHKTARRDPAFSAIAKLNVGLVYVQQKRFDEARRILEELYQPFERDGRHQMLLFLRVLEFPVLANAGAWEQLERACSEVVAEIRARNLVDPDLALPFEIAGEVALDRGHADCAEMLLDFAVEQWKAVGDNERAEATRRKLAVRSTDAPPD